MSLPDPVSDGPFACPGQNGGFLGAAYAPFSIHGDPNDDDFVVHGLSETADQRRVAERRALLQIMDGDAGRLARPPAARGSKTWAATTSRPLTC